MGYHTERRKAPEDHLLPVMAGLVPAIHVFLASASAAKTWMPGTSPGMTSEWHGDDAMNAPGGTVTPQKIEQCEKIIRPHIRRTPIVEVEGKDFRTRGRKPHAETRADAAYRLVQGARRIREQARPRRNAGRVVAASGGNHGVAVAFAAPNSASARSFSPAWRRPPRSSASSLWRRARRQGDRYADALAEARRGRERSGALQVPAFDQDEPCSGQGSSRSSSRSRRRISTPSSWRSAAAD